MEFKTKRKDIIKPLLTVFKTEPSANLSSD